MYISSGTRRAFAAQRWMLIRDWLTRKWPTRVISVSSQLDDDLHAAKRLCGKAGAPPSCASMLHPCSWTPKEPGSKANFCEVEFEHPLRVAAVEIFEAGYTGGVRRIAFGIPAVHGRRCSTPSMWIIAEDLVALCQISNRLIGRQTQFALISTNLKAASCRYTR